MTKNIGFINAASQPFANLFILANTLSQVLSNEIVTANNGPGGGATSAGNGFVIGIFGANTLVGNVLRGANVTSTTAISLGSNLISNSTNFYVSGNNVVGQLVYANTSGTTTQIVDTFVPTAFRTAEYLLSITDNVANNYQASKILILQAKGAIQITEYAILVSNTAMGAFSASINTTAAILSFTPVSTNTTIQGVKTLISI